MSYLFMPKIKLKFKKEPNNRCWRECANIGILVHYGVDVKWYGHFGTQVGSFLEIKLKVT